MWTMQRCGTCLVAGLLVLGGLACASSTRDAGGDTVSQAPAFDNAITIPMTHPEGGIWRFETNIQQFAGEFRYADGQWTFNGRIHTDTNQQLLDPVIHVQKSLPETVLFTVRLAQWQKPGGPGKEEFLQLQQTIPASDQARFQVFLEVVPQ